MGVVVAITLLFGQMSPTQPCTIALPATFCFREVCRTEIPAFGQNMPVALMRGIIGPTTTEFPGERN
jgi:hypothetical protein